MFLKRKRKTRLNDSNIRLKVLLKGQFIFSRARNAVRQRVFNEALPPKVRISAMALNPSTAD
jgi:hypothetical protein